MVNKRKRRDRRSLHSPRTGTHKRSAPATLHHNVSAAIPVQLFRPKIRQRASQPQRINAQQACPHTGRTRYNSPLLDQTRDRLYCFRWFEEDCGSPHYCHYCGHLREDRGVQDSQKKIATWKTRKSNKADHQVLRNADESHRPIFRRRAEKTRGTSRW